MPSNLKRIVRARMAKTGESYQQALRQVRAQVRFKDERGRSERTEGTPSVPRMHIVSARQLAAMIARRPIEVVKYGRIVLVRLCRQGGER
jgi:hypothetical protein